MIRSFRIATKSLHIAGLCTLIFMLPGCKTITMNGQFVSDKEISIINQKKPSQDELFKIIGSPTYIPDYTHNACYYIQRSTYQVAWFKPKVVQQRIVKVLFDRKQNVSKVLLVKDTYDQDIKLSDSYTKSYGNEKNGIQKFVKNLGRFNGGGRVSNRGKKKNK